MLEDPSYSEIVRWGDEGDSFVVLEVRIQMRALSLSGRCPLAISLAIGTDHGTVRKIHQDDSTQTFQAQQLCQFRPPTEQV